MANPKHLEILKQGVEVWNKWRDKNLDDIDNQPDLSNTDLSKINLSQINLSKADLTRVNFAGTNLDTANFNRAILKNTIFDTDTVIENKWILVRDIVSNDDESKSLRGTDLSNANLNNAILLDADLYGVNFDNSDLSGAYIQDSDLTKASFCNASLFDTDFSDSTLVRAIFKKAYLHGTQFYGADLTSADFTKAELNWINFNESILIKANFFNSKLFRVEFCDADLSNSVLSGVCIEDWNINTETNLENVQCDHIFLKDIWNEEEKKFIFTERRPHTGNFKPGDFERLVRKVQGTVDLIFRYGIDWKAFLDAYENLQAEAGGTIFPIRTIDSQSDGSFVIRLQVPPELNKAKIQKSIEAKYKRALKIRVQQYRKELHWKDEKIEIYKKENTNLWEMVKLKASQPFNNIQNQGDLIISGDKYTQSGNFGIGHMSGGKINEGAKVAGVINEAEQRNLAEAAAEIQQLLEQLETSYPTNTTIGKMTIATEAISQIENNPKLMRRVLSALKAGGISAFEQFLNHPAASFVIGALEDWQNTKENQI